MLWCVSDVVSDAATLYSTVANQPVAVISDTLFSETENLASRDVPSATEDTLCLFPRKKRPWRAAAQLVGFNASLQLFDRFVLKGAYAQSTIHDIRRNLKLTNWFWDSDVFYTNLVAHPYHGSLHYNIARSNGMNFLESTGYTIGGDLLWEFFGETEMPSVNDLISTAAGGIAIGEVTHRVARQVYRPQWHGFRRVMNELLGAAFNPMGALNRVLTGEAWTVARPPAEDTAAEFEATLSVGWRHVGVNDSTHTRFNTPYLYLHILYGDPYEDNYKPYDYFDAGMAITVGSGQKFVSRIHILGELYGRNIVDKPHFQAKAGLYQHFGYAYTNPVKGGSAAYQISEAASAGIGLMYKAYDTSGLCSFEQQLFFNGMGLGGMFSDYLDNPARRNYNMGSGFTAKIHNTLTVSNLATVRFDADFYRMFTWLDYSMPVNSKPGQHLTAQGEAGNVSLWTLSPQLKIDISKSIAIKGFGCWYVRRSNYKHYPNVHLNSLECGMGVVCKM